MEPGAGATGLRLSLTPRWGTAESRDVFWREDYALRGVSHAPEHPHLAFDGRLGYTFALRGARGTVQRFGEVVDSRTDSSRARIGLRYEIDPTDTGRPTLLELSSERVDFAGRPPTIVRSWSPGGASTGAPPEPASAAARRRSAAPRRNADVDVRVPVKVRRST